MSLRDDLVNQQKEQSQKNREKAKEDKALSLQREQNYKQQKAQLQKQKEDAFDAFARQVKEGHVPDEWVKLYDGYVEKIKEHILKGNLSFHFKDAVSADYYQEKASVNKGKNSVVTLMNDYLTKRLKQDGFSSNPRPPKATTLPDMLNTGTIRLAKAVQTKFVFAQIFQSIVSVVRRLPLSESIRQVETQERSFFFVYR